MSTLPTVREEQAVAPASIYEVLGALARDPLVDVARITQLMDLQLRAEAHQAEKEFNAAFARLQPKMPRITKRGKIEMGTKGMMKFARYEDLDAAIKPLYTAEGFSLSFSSRATDKGIILVGILKHNAGHTLTPAPELQLPPDAGAGRNSLQALGSSLSYAKRYLTCDIFNIVTVDEDNDGTSISAITEQQVIQIEGMLADNELGADYRSKLLETMNVKALSDLQRVQVPTILSLIRAKIKAKGAK